MMYLQGGKGGAGRRLLAACMVLMLALASSAGWCQANGPNADDSSLRKFEKGAQPKRAPSAPPSARSSYPSAPVYQSSPAYPPTGGDDADPDGDSLDDFLVELTVDVIKFAVHNGAILVSQQSQRTLQRISPAENAEQRHDGDSLIPFVRYDYSRQNVASGIDGGFHRLEAGYGPAALMFENYTLRDSAAQAQLTLERYLFLYRYSPDRKAEYDVGFGATKLYGATTISNPTLSLVGRFMIRDHLALELRPSWAGTISDYEASLAWTLHYTSLKAGYRSMTSPGGTLQGPFIGFALHD